MLLGRTRPQKRSVSFLLLELTSAIGNSAEYADYAYLPGSVTPLAPLVIWASKLITSINAPAGQASF